ncbi:MAG: AraC family transcriptional regulator [Hydrogenophaga sp.]|nr:AraC family transcriptional regulator [Hydrogenophaga sp.]
MQAKVTESKQYVSMKEGATALAPAHERLKYWEDYTASELVGIRCTSYAEAGLDARQRNFDLGAFRIADIVGNEHVVERSMPQVQRHPKHALLACLLMDGEAFFFQSGRCTMVHSGDLIVYNSVKPYLFGFTRPMRLLMVDISPSDLFESASALANESLIKVDGHLRAGKMLTQPVRETLLGFLADPLSEKAPSVADDVCARLRLICQSQSHEKLSGEEVAALRLLKAEQFIAEHIADPLLDAKVVAKHVAMSVRHLNRVFEVHQCSVTQWIWRERLEMAHRQLVDPALMTRSISEIALGCGFSTQSHFAREFKSHYGLTPSQHRMMLVGR